MSLILSGCAPEAPEPAASEANAPRTIVDSILPIEEEVRRFRATIGPEPAGLTGGATSRDALVGRFIDALATPDTAAFADMVVNIEEFGWLYYPSTRFTAPPYELPPGLVWFQIQNGSSQGLGRLLERLARRRVELLGYQCMSEPTPEGENRLWDGCVVRFDTPDEGPRELTLFGTILEREGVFKFLSYSNGF